MKGWVFKVDWFLVAIVLALVSFGLLMIYSSTMGMKSESLYFVKRQLVAVFLGSLFLVALFFVNYRYLASYAYFLYGAGLALLMVVLFLGKSVYGAQRWISFGFFDLQPSEFAKVLMVIFLAAYLAERRGEIEWREVFTSLLFVVIPVGLIFIQPDLGTALVIVVVWLAILLAAGGKLKHFAVVFLIGLVAILILWQGHFLKEYQINRLLVFLQPDLDPQGSGYNLRQAQIAIGSGGLWGKGFLSGTQTNLRFIPVRHADFIFAVVGEELGFLGTAFLIFLFLLLITRLQIIALEAKELFPVLILTGVSAMWLFQVIVNVGMNLGIMPVTGIPLPFFSYGGSAMMSNLSAVGLVLSLFYQER